MQQNGENLFPKFLQQQILSSIQNSNEESQNVSVSGKSANKKAIYIDSLSNSCPQPARQNVSRINSASKNTKRKIVFNSPSAKTKQQREPLNAIQNLNYNDGQDDDGDEDEDESLSLRNNLREITEQQIKQLPQNPVQNNETITTQQILSRLVQIREYLKQAYSTMTALQTSDDLQSYEPQLAKLHSLIDHLKDQEKGYMDLLKSVMVSRTS
jgi:hypothetical protein